MAINRVTITGADNSIRPEELIPLSEQYPFVEWAILVSSTKADNPRYPTHAWIDELAKVGKSHNLQLAGHICGAWVRDLVIQREPTVFVERPEFLEYFPRIQLNFSPYHAAQLFLDLLKPYKNQFIFQVGTKGKSEKVTLLNLGRSMGLDLAVLFDRSGGKGILPTSWPEPLDPFYCGYAGGLGPDSLEEQMPKIVEVLDSNQPAWVDMESRVRSDDDKLFDLEKVRTCLEICSKWVQK